MASDDLELMSIDELWALLSLTVNNASPALDKKAQEVALIARALGNRCTGPSIEQKAQPGKFELSRERSGLSYDRSIISGGTR
jgi:hypothetical protein